MQCINPTTGIACDDHAWMDASVVQQRVERSHATFERWRQTSFHRRQQALLALADAIEAHLEEGAASITQAMGKPIVSARSELTKCIECCRYYADNSEAMLAPCHITTDWQKSYVSYQPLGVILAIMPWNYPIWQVIRVLAPNIMLGNALVLSHAPIVLPCAWWLKTMTEKALWPEGLLDVLVMEHTVCAKVIGWPQIQGVTLTGSVQAGSQVAALAGQHLKPCVMELGGNDPYIVLADADPVYAAKTCAAMRLANSGQVCISAKRLLVVDAVYDAFLAALQAELDGYTVGDPMDVKTDLGPLARADLRERVHEQVQRSIRQGAVCHRGGVLPQGPGFFYPITLLTNVKPGMTVFEEEVFGPVVSIVRVPDEASAIQWANQSDFGLGACVFSQDVARAETLVRDDIEAGFVTVNRPVTSHIKMPFGGIKQSGFGRELGVDGLHAFANRKTVCVHAIEEY